MHVQSLTVLCIVDRAQQPDPPLPPCLQCGLGDAFRCGGCPYRGLPAFEMGKKIELPSDFLAVDL